MSSATTLTDEQREVIRKFLENFFEKNKGFLVNLQKRTAPEKGVAFEDVSQNAIVNFCKSFNTIKSNMDGFFAACLENSLNEFWRIYGSKHGKLVSFINSIGEDEINNKFEPSYLPQIESEYEAAQLIKKLFSIISKEEKEFLEMTYWEELPDKEICLRLGLSGSAVRTRRSRLKDKCRHILNEIMNNR